ncbi:MAG: UbiH/UbiF/VisC/COQ6 family ubiquinone biosynthesis hydroxylase [Gammaproteobacteria bacterium]|nr:UbiH/UbiF/VisC/COQ6 family ubiquinone biosynthesis hydroxylase [Gammaproteobacteria bacterium]
MSAPRSFQVAIVGGGIVGSAIALILSRAGIQTALLEKNTILDNVAGQDYGLRVSAISLASEYLFRNLQIWDELAARRISPYRHMQVSDAAGSATLHFDAAEIQQPHLGHIIENDLLLAVILQRLRQQDAFKLISPVDIQAIDIGSRQVVLRLKQQPDIAVQLLIGADGADSMVRKISAIDISQWPYHQYGLVSVVRTAQAHLNTAWQRFLPGGPVAFLPLQDGTCSIVWSVPDEEAIRLKNLDEKEFCAALSEASGNILGEILSCGARAVFPLRYQHANKYAQERLVLIGDAAHVVHPLAGQGVNLGLLDVTELGQLLLAANARNTDLGTLKLLRRYERSRRSENTIMGLTFDALNRLFLADAEVVVTARNLGMSIVDHSQWLKRFFVQRATGLEQLRRMQQRGRNSLFDDGDQW